MRDIRLSLLPNTIICNTLLLKYLGKIWYNKKWREKIGFFVFQKKLLKKIKKISETVQPNENFVVYIGVGQWRQICKTIKS